MRSQRVIQLSDWTTIGNTENWILGLLFASSETLRKSFNLSCIIFICKIKEYMGDSKMPAMDRQEHLTVRTWKFRQQIQRGDIHQLWVHWTRNQKLWSHQLPTGFFFWQVTWGDNSYLASCWKYEMRFYAWMNIAKSKECYLITNL